jgi:uncharacterized delta-60 repeat protein
MQSRSIFHITPRAYSRRGPATSAARRSTGGWLRVARVAVAIAAAASLPGAPGRAASGDLDPSFGVGGRVTTDFGGRSDHGEAVVVQADGKLVAGGWSFTLGTDADPFNEGFALARYNADGSPDTSFGAGGKVITDFGAREERATALAVQPDGKILLAGSLSLRLGGYQSAVARYNPDGSLDAGFGAGGKVVTEFGIGLQDLRALAIQPDGKVVVAGYTTAMGGVGGFLIARYDAGGVLDPSFGVGGAVVLDLAAGGSGSGLANDVVVQPDGKIVVAGGAVIHPSSFILVRLGPDGSPDPSFGSGGVVRSLTGLVSGLGVDSVELQPDGKLVAVGASAAAGPFALTVARYAPDGSLDPSFGTGGVATADFEGEEQAVGLVRQDDGKLVAAAWVSEPSGIYGLRLARFDDVGVLDASFGTGGKILSSFLGRSSQAKGLTIQADGKLVAGGRGSGDGTSIDFALARYVTAVPVLDVSLDVRPGACPNPFNTGSRGALPVAVAGTAAFDVSRIDPATIRLGGLAPLSWRVEDVATPFEAAGTGGCADCAAAGGDGTADFAMRFDSAALAAALGPVSNGECRVLALTGRLRDGTPIRGQDVIRVIAH